MALALGTVGEEGEERALLRLLGKALHAAAKGWRRHLSCQCLVGKIFSGQGAGGEWGGGGGSKGACHALSACVSTV